MMGTTTMFWMITAAAVLATMTARRAMMNRTARVCAMRPAHARYQRPMEANAPRTDRTAANRIPSDWK